MFTTESATASSFVAVPFGPPVIANDATCSLRQDAMASDAASTEELPLAQLWSELASGSCRAIDAFFDAGRCYIVTNGVEKRSRRPRNLQSLVILESLLRGSAQKAIAFDLGLAPSTVTANARDGLAWLGLISRPTRVHPLLILAASAAGEHDESVTGTLSFVTRGGASARVVSVARPELALPLHLPPAERDIVRCLVEGYSHAAMARLRGTSKRTIANQISSVFRRLGVIGRMELVHRLFAFGRVSGSPPSSGGAHVLTG